MTEKLNVAVKITLNRIRAILALLFWIISGVVGFVYINNGGSFFKSYRYSRMFHMSHSFNYLSLIPLIAGLIIGIVRLFVINDKFAWQVATLEEIRELRKIIADLGIKKSIQSNLSSNTTGTKNTTSSTIKPEDVWVCTNCGETNPAGTKFCQKCGK